MRTAEFKTQGYQMQAMLGRRDAGRYVLQIVNTETNEPEHAVEMKGAAAPDLFLSEVITFLANRLQVRLVLQEEDENDA